MKKKTFQKTSIKELAKGDAFHAFLIRIPLREAMLRAVAVLGEVRVPYCGFANSRLLVVNDHLDALRRAKIPFETLS